MSRRAQQQPTRKQQAARGRQPMRKPVAGTPAWVAPAAVVIGLVVVVVAFLIYRWYVTPQPPPAPSEDTTAQVITILTTLPASEFDAVGQGTAENRIKPISSGAALTGSSGKPVVFYYGAEYCPYCAAERWSIIVALSRFGSWSGLQTTSSSSTDIFANTPTFTFRSATYTSQYIEFQSVETTDRDQKPLQSPTAAQQQLVTKYDSDSSIPFVDFANKYQFSGATYSPQVINGESWLAIANALKTPDSSEAKAIIGSANLITAAVCKSDGDQPAAVCSSTTIQTLEKNLK